jgi:hypothetical protein
VSKLRLGQDLTTPPRLPAGAALDVVVAQGDRHKMLCFLRVFGHYWATGQALECPTRGRAWLLG